jgi:hypothetical protein
VVVRNRRKESCQVAINNPDTIENFKSSSYCPSRWMVHSSVLSDMDGHQESQFEWLSANLLSGSKVKECCQVQHLVHNFIVGTFANQFPIVSFSIPPALHVIGCCLVFYCINNDRLCYVICNVWVCVLSVGSA